MYKINDVVRLIPPTYKNIHKTFNSPYHWKQCNPDLDDHLMLGGKYHILGLPKNIEDKHIFYSLLKNSFNHMDKTLGDFLVPDENVINCPFQLGDNVKFILSDEEIEKFFFPVYDGDYSFSDRHAVYKITEVLNDFYIFLNYQKGDPRSAPFRWDNFERV